MNRTAVRALITNLREPIFHPTSATNDDWVLDAKTEGLVGIGAAVAIGASTATYRRLVSQALVAGATADECISAALSVAPTVGVSSIVTAAPRLASALGYEMDWDVD